jgi:phosphatidate cytidylyltransferase
VQDGVVRKTGRTTTHGGHYERKSFVTEGRFRGAGKGGDQQAAHDDGDTAESTFTDGEERRQQRNRDSAEGVRLIGADEAAEALERDDIRHRLRDDEPRFGDRPASAEAAGTRPALRFPLGSYEDPTAIARPPVVPVQPPTEAPELSHWAGSAAEEVPKMNRRDPRQGDDPWSTLADSDPRWRDDPRSPAGSSGPPPRRPPAPPPVEPTRQRPAVTGDDWQEPGQPQPSDPGQGAPVSYEEDVEPPPGRSVFADAGQQPAYEDAYADEAYADEYDATYDETYDDAYGDEAYGDEMGGGYGPEGRGVATAPRRRARRRAPRRITADRDLRVAIGVGVAFAAVALLLFKFAGEAGGMIVAVPVLGYAAYEYFTAANKAGHEALLPVGVVSTVGFVIAAYNYGEAALPVVMVLSVAVCFLWYLVRAAANHPVPNIGVTLLGIGWIGLFGSFAGLLLNEPGGNGVAFLLAAVIPTIAYDVGALFVGRSAGSRPLSEASPNKTIEGLVGGMVLAVAAGVVFATVGGGVFPFDTASEGIKLGVLVALVAPLGDLSESLVKRDLRVKDMGSILPGHGGLLDRFDALLFVLPAVWYLARVSDFFLT